MQRLPQVDRWLEELRSLRHVALDTNLVIYALEDVAPYNELARHLFRMMERGFIRGTASIVVQAEVLVKPLRERNQLAIEQADLFFRQAPMLVVRNCDQPIARRAALVRAGTRLPLVDAIIVATALEERCDALIGNDAAMAQRAVGIPYLYLESYVS